MGGTPIDNRTISAPAVLSQFAGPHGLLGHVAGWLMARLNGPYNRWAIDLLAVGEADRVLEIGYGPGLAIAAAAARATRGAVVGVDRSAVMQAQASRRNRAAVRAGRVRLIVGSVDRLPFPDRAFTRACAINSLQFWPSTRDALAEILRVLAPGGRLVLALRMRTEGVGRFDRRRYGFTAACVEEIAALLRALGCDVVTTTSREFRGETITAVLARRGGTEA
jgi:ubiquinone/menaquinone biosynthesis C-methylase UbiE